MAEHGLAVIGFGGMGGWHVENVSSRIKGIKVKGIYDIREEARQKAKDMGLHVYGSLEEILSDECVDLVTVATPNNFHKDYAIACLKAGKNVVSEKPVTLNAAELMEIIKVQKASGKLFSVHQNRRWDKDFVTVKKVLESDEIGEPYFIESRVQGSRRAMHGWRGYTLNGGGMLLDWGVHLLDQLLQLVPSKVVSVNAHLFSLYSDEVDDNIKIILRFENGVSALTEMATNCLINLPRWHVSCREGTMEIADWAVNGKMVKLKTDQEMEWSDDIVYTEAGPTRTMAPRPKQTTEEFPLPKVKSEWTDYYENVLAAIEGKEALLVTPEQALRVMKVVDAAFESHKQGCGIHCTI